VSEERQAGKVFLNLPTPVYCVPKPKRVHASMAVSFALYIANGCISFRKLLDQISAPCTQGGKRTVHES